VWYDIQAPGMFSVQLPGKTPVNKASGSEASQLAGRVFDVSLGDLNKDPQQGFRNMKLIAEDIKGKRVLTNFYGMDMTRDKLCSLIRKWQTLIEADVEVKTTDGYNMRIFAIGFTRKRAAQVKKTCYAQGSQVRKIRQKMRDIITAEATKSDLKGLVAKFIAESIGKQIETECREIYPLQNVFIRKVKMLKMPKIEADKLRELHEREGGVTETGEAVDTEGIVEGSGGRL
ncbi:unnamed protein product, partial [Symbiodinium sp. KB8]